MTKLTPIEELAKQVGLMDNEGNLLVHCEPSEKENRELDADILKSFRQAIISDFVSKLNVAMTTSAYTDDDGVFHPSAKLRGRLWAMCYCGCCDIVNRNRLIVEKVLDKELREYVVDAL